MKTISYDPSKDELMFKLRYVKKKPTKEIGPFKLWWDNEGNIYALDIISYTEELKEFKNNLNRIKLGGIWKGIKISDEDIKEARKDLLKKLEEKY